MALLTLEIDGRPVSCQAGTTILQAADAAAIYIPRLCAHPDLPPAGDVNWAESIFQFERKFESQKSDAQTGEEGHCNLCVVAVSGSDEPVRACSTAVTEGMVVQTADDQLTRRRRDALRAILVEHPHACLTCAQKEGCSRTDCSSNVPVEERCCVLLGRCELEKVADYIGIPPDTPKYRPLGAAVLTDEPLFDRDFNLCIGCLRCVRACGDLRGVDVLGAVWNGDRIRVGTRTEGRLNEAECRFCGACVEVCPTGALRDKEGAPAVRKDAPLPCVGSCPLGIDIPHYVQLIALGRHQEALELIRNRTPFPALLGYVCFHPCEESCRRGEVDQPVAICALKRFAADSAAGEGGESEREFPETGKRVAIVGAGPAGLVAAYYLRLKGHEIDLFDRGPRPGGMLTQAIPAYRLPERILERELRFLEQAGIQFHAGTDIGRDLDTGDLKARGFNAVLLAVGTAIGKDLPIEGTQLEGIEQGLEFLREAREGTRPTLGGRVVVIGGGNVAVDAAMTAVRLNAAEVHMVCLEAAEEMPAHDSEIAQAEAEGVEIHPGWGPREFTSENGRVSGVELIRCTRVFDQQGQFRPEFDPSVTEHVPADSVIITIGQSVESRWFEQYPTLQKKSDGTIRAGADTTTDVDGVFAAGDVVAGPSSVVEAMAAGRKAADSIDRYLGGDGLAEIRPDVSELDHARLGAWKEASRRPRQIAHTVAPEQRRTGFDLIEATFTEEAAKLEAERCLQCNLRRLITPVVLPPDRWLPLDAQTVAAVPGEAGVFQLRTDEKKVIRISGAADMRAGLSECLENPGAAVSFAWEAEPMYTRRESELIQQHLQEHGELPGGGAGGDDLDDLF